MCRIISISRSRKRGALPVTARRHDSAEQVAVGIYRKDIDGDGKVVLCFRQRTSAVTEKLSPHFPFYERKYFILTEEEKYNKIVPEKRTNIRKQTFEILK